MLELLVLFVPLAGIAALVFAWTRAQWVRSQDPGDATMVRISDQIRRGAFAFLGREYLWLSLFVFLVAGALLVTYWGPIDGSGGARSPLIALSFVVGAGASALAGFFGMEIATRANTRTTSAARTGFSKALAVAFAGGSVMGMCVVGLALLGLGLLFLTYCLGVFPTDSSRETYAQTLGALAGFSMGASSIALFARVGGGIYTKAADVGADLVGKVEAGLPEDDPRNPAVIADNVGDNVGDVAGMGADLFESYVGAIIGTMVLGLGFTVVGKDNPIVPIILPLLLASAGIGCSILGTYLVKTTEDGDAQAALDRGAFSAAGLMVLVSALLCFLLWPGLIVGGEIQGQTMLRNGIGVIAWWQPFVAIVIGLAVGVCVGLITAHYCSLGRGPVNGIAEQSRTGYATNIIAGLAVGMESTTLPVLLIAGGVVGAYAVCGLYGVAIAALGMLSTTGIQLAVDAYGPIADNAGGIAEMSGQEPDVRRRTDTLDAVGNTTAAIGKGFAIASAAMTALALFAAFIQEAGLQERGINLANPLVIAGLLVGGMLPFLFSSMAMQAVGRAANEMVEEVRRQFKQIDGLLEGRAEPDTERCVAISTNAAIRRMVLPGLLAVFSPVLVGAFFGAEALGGLLAGVTVSGVLMAIFMANSGGAWDNAKKSFEGDGFRAADGQLFPKGSDPHSAAVVGDTVGDPFKDTAGPSLNILIKLISVIALIIAPLLISSADRNGAAIETETNDQAGVATQVDPNVDDPATNLDESVDPIDPA